MCRLHPEVSFQEEEVMHLALGQRNLTEDASPAFWAGRKLGEVEQALLWTLLYEDPACPSRVLLDKVAQRQRPLAVTLRHVNRWRATWGLNRRRGRPRQVEGHRPVAAGAEVVHVTPRLSCVGVHLFARWLDHQEAFGPALSTCALILLHCYLICEFPRLSLGGNKHAAEHHLCPLRQGASDLCHGSSSLGEAPGCPPHR